MKNKNSLMYFIFVIVLFSFSFSEVHAIGLNDDAINIVVNAYNLKELPKNFRKTNDKVNIKNNESINLQGLEKLNASGSAQFSQNGLSFVKDSIGNKMPITVIDLRQESHGFVNGIAISWENKKNDANKGLTTQQILNDENEKLKNVLNKMISLGHNNTNIIKVESVENEEQLAGNNGMKYIRIPVTDKKKPSNEAADYFVKVVKTLPDNTWLHFHCKAGVGRTTTFMVMYDMMKNAKKVSLEDIVKRQELIGGKNLVNDNKAPTNKEGRVEFIKNFYKYCSENQDDFATSWSQWLKNNNISLNNESTGTVEIPKISKFAA